MRERATLVTFDGDQELTELAKASGLDVSETMVCRLREPNASLYLGKGKVQEVADAVKDSHSNVAVFDTDLTPSQQRNLEEILLVKTIDRTGSETGVPIGRNPNFRNTNARYSPLAGRIGVRLTF